MKTLVELEQDLKAIEENVDAIREMISIDRPYTDFDRQIICAQKDVIETSLQNLSENLNQVAQYATATLLDNAHCANINALRESAKDILRQATIIAIVLNDFEERTNNYLALYDQHP